MKQVETSPAQSQVRAVPQCRFCSAPLRHTFVDLGMSPLCESYVRPERLNEMEPFYPLHVRICEECLLVQLEEFVSPQEIFGEYAYFSSYSDSWVRHAEEYCRMMMRRFGIGPRSRVIEIASNDGYLLQHFVRAGVPALGIEPAGNVAAAAVEKGVPTLVRFFGQEAAEEVLAEHGPADLLIGNNVLAQVPDLNDFVAGMKVLLSGGGVITVEFPHLLRLMEQNQFDTIYHEHFSYFSFHTVEQVFGRHGLEVFDVEELGTHGGSLRVYARHGSGPAGSGMLVSGRVERMREVESAWGMLSVDGYDGFAERVRETKWKLLEFLIGARRRGKQIVGYGAPGKGNTLLNYCGIRTDLLDYTVDRNPHKQGLFLPGTRIPVYPPDRIAQTRPDYVLILPWNLKREIMEQMAFIREWGGEFVVPIPEVAVCSEGSQ